MTSKDHNIRDIQRLLRKIKTFLSYVEKTTTLMKKLEIYLSEIDLN